MNSVYIQSGVSRQAHHKAKVLAQSRLLYREDLLCDVRQARLSHPRMGSRPLHRMLDVQGMGINQFERMLSEEGLGIKRRVNRCRTTDGHLFRGQSVNRVNGKELDDINQLWVSDITYFLTGDKVFYIMMIMDVYSRRILAAEVYPDMFAKNSLSVLRASLKQRGIANYGGQLVHHSDKGSQYMCGDYKKMLKRYGIVLSVAENSLQNAYAERINGTIKNDYLRFFHTQDLRLLRKHLTRSVQLYNHQRPHASLKYMTPMQYETSLGKGRHEKMTLYDFNAKVINEFFSGIGNQNDCQLKKQAHHEPDISVGQRYSLDGCSPAEPSSASLCRYKNNCNQSSKIKKLSTST